MTTQLFTRQTHIHLLYNVICFVLYIMYMCKVRSLPVAIIQYITLTLNIFQNKFAQSIIYYRSDNTNVLLVTQDKGLSVGIQT